MLVVHLALLVVSMLPVHTAATLDVWLVPHSHCDTGWMTTVDQYYDTEVEQILTTATERLTSDTSARFVWSETKWLSMWWPKQTPAKRLPTHYPKWTVRVRRRRVEPER